MENLYLLRRHRYLAHLSQLDPHKCYLQPQDQHHLMHELQQRYPLQKFLSFSDFQRYLRQLKEDR